MKKENIKSTNVNSEVVLTISQKKANEMSKILDKSNLAQLKALINN